MMPRTLQQVLAEVDRADIFFGTRVTSVHTERSTGETALHIVAKWGDAEAIRVLVAHGADLDKPGEDDNTPLHYAAMLGQFAAVECLVELGARRRVDIYGNTPAQLAKEHEAVHRFLVDRGF